MRALTHVTDQEMGRERPGLRGRAGMTTQDLGGLATAFLPQVRSHGLVVPDSSITFLFYTESIGIICHTCNIM